MGEDQTPVAPAKMPVPGTVVAERFRLDDRIGTGGLGAVWRATDLELERTVAIKVLHPHLAERADVAERFRLEALATARIGHPNVLRVFDAGHERGVAYLVTEHIAGVGLDQLISEGPIAPIPVAAIGAQTASALAAAHEAGMIHRDVKPSNLLLDGHGRVRLIDFGVAKLADVASELTGAGEAVGSWAYLAPEQLNSEPVDRPADVYALGLVMWEACTGESPFSGDTPTAIALARLTQPVPSLPELPDLPAPLRDIVRAATSTDPADRPDARSIADTLMELTGPRPYQHLASLVAGRPGSDEER